MFVYEAKDIEEFGRRKDLDSLMAYSLKGLSAKPSDLKP